MSKKKPSMNFSLLNGFSESLSSEGLKSPKFSIKSPRIYETGVVGLGIVAAMNEVVDTQEGFLSAKPSRDAKKMAVSPKSQPIPITSTRIANKFRESDEDEEFLSESYTCVISHVGSRSIRKREYFNESPGDCFNHQERSGMTSSHGIKGKDDNYWNRKAVFSSSPLENFDAERGNSDSGFLSYCHLCRKSLHDLDIFMYRGDKGYCSVECRSQQILCDELKEKSWSGSLKVADFFFSPYSASRPLAGFAAA